MPNWNPLFSPISLIHHWVRGSKIFSSSPHHHPHILLSILVFAVIPTLSPTPILYKEGLNCWAYLVFQTRAFVPGYSIEADFLQREKCSVAEGPEIELVCVGLQGEGEGTCVSVYAHVHALGCGYFIYTGEILRELGTLLLICVSLLWLL